MWQLTGSWLNLSRAPRAVRPCDRPRAVRTFVRLCAVRSFDLTVTKVPVSVRWEHLAAQVVQVLSGLST